MRRQRGITFLGFIIVAAVVGLFIYIGMVLFPIYSENSTVRNAMQVVQSTPGAAQMSPNQIHALLQKNFDIGYVDSVKANNIFLINQNGRKLRIAYEVRKPMVYNIDVVAKFDHTVDLNRPGGG